MRFTVIWLDDAEDQLAAAYLTGREHGLGDECTEASDRIDTVLRSAALTAGESRGRRQRVPVEWPLSVTIEVHEPEDVVVVLKVHFFTARRA
jgi:hypothetical protein